MGMIAGQANMFDCRAVRGAARRDSLETALPAPVCHRVRRSRRLADVNVSSAVKRRRASRQCKTARQGRCSFNEHTSCNLS